ncbi:LysR family transcriptional regulator [Cupriavidus plantarum]|uniref:LysR family transcriptional regulator n=1 Tax=Cupriavidus plantarum TaxID=942865 RepID=A0A316ESY1_9BURK|nr:LysR family transcriptional regulator [Cupriavidus plantarum]PWK35106.1 LysR family transcriptional regulator [Cupriavidus plantarum]RLK38976.1 LysR family transcriptional regulator [Cupriavidus plantarum]
MGRLEAIRIFAKVAETQSFSKTADLMDLPRGSVSRTIQTLEEQLEVRLLSRSTRQVSLTDAGKLYYERCQQILTDLAEVEAELTHARTVSRGTVRIDTSGSIARSLVVPALDAFYAQYPDIDVRIGIADRNIDLIQEGVDFVLRAGPLEASSLVARRIGNARIVTCASPAYLERHGVPRTFADLDRHVAVNYASPRTGRILPFAFIEGDRTVNITMKGRLAVNEGSAYIESGLRGLGIIQPTRFYVAELIREGKLVEILQDAQTLSTPLSIVYTNRNHIHSAVRVFMDWLAETLRRNPDIDG